MKKILLFSYFVLAALLAVLVARYLPLEINSLQAISQVFIHYQWMFTIWRYALYGTLLWLWPAIVSTVGKRQQWPKEAIVLLSQQRLKLFFFFVLFELLFVHNIVAHLFA